MEDELPVNVLRSAKEIARRALTLSSVISVAYGDSSHKVIEWLGSEQLLEELSPSELQFISTDEPTKKEIIAFTWHLERLVPLLWSIQKLPALPALNSQCDTDLMKKAIVWPPATTQNFIETAVLREEAEICEEYEKVYQAHWQIRNAQRSKIPLPEGLNEDVIPERHWGFNWVIGYSGQAWDDISTDT